MTTKQASRSPALKGAVFARGCFAIFAGIGIAFNGCLLLFSLLWLMSDQHDRFALYVILSIAWLALCVLFAVLAVVGAIWGWRIRWVAILLILSCSWMVRRTYTFEDRVGLDLRKDGYGLSISVQQREDQTLVSIWPEPR